MKYSIFGVVVVFNFMLEHFELVKCPLCSSFCCVLLIFLYGIKGCFLSKIYSLNILLNQHPTRLSFTPYTATTTRTILISLKTQKIYYKISNIHKKESQYQWKIDDNRDASILQRLPRTVQTCTSGLCCAPRTGADKRRTFFTNFWVIAAINKTE